MLCLWDALGSFSLKIHVKCVFEKPWGLSFFWFLMKPWTLFNRSFIQLLANSSFKKCISQPRGLPMHPNFHMTHATERNRKLWMKTNEIANHRLRIMRTRASVFPRIWNGRKGWKRKFLAKQWKLKSSSRKWRKIVAFANKRCQK